MKKRAAKGRPRQSTVVPPITVSFEEAMTKLLKVKPPAGTAKKSRLK